MAGTTEKREYVVAVNVPTDLSDAEMRAYISDAVRSYGIGGGTHWSVQSVRNHEVAV